MFLAVFHSFSIFLCQKSKSLPVLFAQLLFFKDQWKRFDHVALYKRAAVSESLIYSVDHKKWAICSKIRLSNPQPRFFHDSNASRPLINRLSIFEFSFDFTEIFCSVSSKMLTPQCALHLWIKILGLLNPNFLYLEFFSPIMDVLTSKRILPDCSFQSNQILYQQNVWFWLRGKQFDSRAPRSLTLRWDAHPAEFLKDVSLTFEYIGEIQTEFENTQARLWGAQMGSIYEKK